MKPHTPFLVKFLRNEVLQFFVMGGFLLFLVSIVFVISEFLSHDHQKAHIAIAQGLQIIVVFATAWIVARLFKRILAYHYESNAAKKTPEQGDPNASFEVHVPRYIITLFNWAVMLISAGYISTSMFGEAAWNLLTAGGIVGAGIAFSLQGLVQDLTSGLIMDVERRFKVGDWIRIGEESFGEVIRMTWRYMELRTEENTLKLIPNRDLTSMTYENLSHFNGIFAHKITLPLDHNVPFDRVQRVLMEGLLSIPEVTQTGIHTIAVGVVNEGGLTVDVRFGVKGGYHHLIPLRHKVYEVLSRKLWESGIGISESYGAYTITQPSASFKYLEDPKAGDVLKHVPLFDVLTAEERKLLGQKAKKIILNKADILMTIGDQSDSLFVIAEGAVDVIVPIQEGKASMDKVVATLGSGTFVGDRALLLGEKRSATVQAKTQVVCYEVTKKDFEPILKARPAMISGLSEVVLQREASTSAQISEAKKNLPKELNLKQELVKAIQKFFGV